MTHSITVKLNGYSGSPKKERRAHLAGEEENEGSIVLKSEGVQAGWRWHQVAGTAWSNASWVESSKLGVVQRMVQGREAGA